MKKNNIILYIVIMSLQFYFVGCSKKEKEFTVQKIPTYYENGELAGYDTIIKSNPYFEDINKTGTYYLYYESGELKEKAEFHNDTLINENIIYSKSGKELSYRFYNPDGELKLLLENNKYDISSFNPLMYFSYPFNADIYDTIPIEVYIATPSGIIHDLYGISDQGEPFVLDFTRIKPFSYKINYIPDKIGNIKLHLKLVYTNFNSRIIDEFYYELEFVISK